MRLCKDRAVGPQAVVLVLSRAATLLVLVIERGDVDGCGRERPAGRGGGIGVIESITCTASFCMSTASLGRSERTTGLASAVPWGDGAEVFVAGGL